MKFIRLINILIILQVLIGCQTNAQQELNETTMHKINAVFQHVDENGPGYMLGVYSGSEVLFEKGFGLANLEYNQKINSTSAFNIASLSKQFTGACIALLMLEGKVSMEDNINKYIDDFPEYQYDVKIKHLIYMTSGINDYYYNPRKNNTDWSTLHYFNIDTAITASLENDELMYKPGSQWSYSNINYMLLTKVVEKVSGKRFSEFAHDNIFAPLNMSNTFVNDDIFQVIPNRVNGYNYRDEENTRGLIEEGYLTYKGVGFLQINRNSPHYGGSGIYTSMEDFRKWMNNFHSKELGGQEFYDLMHSTMKFDHNKSNDALGLVLADYQGHKMVWYEGGDWGCSSFMMRFPISEISVICFSNMGTGNARKCANNVLDILLKDGIVRLD